MTLVCYDSARYVADYICKADMELQCYSGKALPFQLMSKGLGKGYVDANAPQLRQNLGVTVRGVHVGIPRYYVNRLEGYWPDVKEDMRSREVEAPVSKVAGVWSGAYYGHDDASRLPRLQRELDARAKQRNFKKGKE